MAARKSRAKPKGARPIAVAAYLASLTPEKRAVIVARHNAVEHQHFRRET